MATSPEEAEHYARVIGSGMGCSFCAVAIETQTNSGGATMIEEHANVALLKRLDIRNMLAATDLFAKDVVWHYFNPRLPEFQGDYAGLTEIQTFFETIGAMTSGTFKIEPVSMTAVGEDLVFTQTKKR